MRVSSQSQHSESWIFQHFGIHPRELGAKNAMSEGGKRRVCAKKKRKRAKRVKAKKEKASSKRRARRRRRRSTAEWSARWCTSIPSTNLSSFSTVFHLLADSSFEPILLVAPSRAFKAAAATAATATVAATHRSQDEKCYVTTVAGWIERAECIFHPSPCRRDAAIVRFFALSHSPARYPSFIFAVLSVNAHASIRARSSSDGSFTRAFYHHTVPLAHGVVNDSFCVACFSMRKNRFWAYSLYSIPFQSQITKLSAV